MKNNNRFLVYKHIFPNGKIYIGITTKSPSVRWGKNGYGYKTQFVGRAIRKYGWENIKHIIVRDNLTESDAKMIEKKMIKHYKTTDWSYGYNRTSGGDSKNHGYHLSNLEKEKRANCAYSESLKRDIDCYGLDGKYIKTFHGYKEIFNELGVVKSNVIQSAQHQIGRAKNYIFRFHDDNCGNQIEKYIESQPTNIKRVNQYSLDGQYIKTFNSASEAGRTLGVRPSGISACCLGKYKTSNNYIWSFAEINKKEITPQKNMKPRRIVAQYDLQGNLIQVFSTMKEAARITGIRYDIIRHFMDGKRKSGEGYIWKTVEVKNE